MIELRKTIRPFHEPGELHELTFSCDRWMPLLTHDGWREKLNALGLLPYDNAD